MSNSDYRDYGFEKADASHMHVRFLPEVLYLGRKMLQTRTRILDVGCGNGYTAGQFLNYGCDVTGIDLSESGVALARQCYPAARFEVLAADSDILQNLNCDAFDLVVSTEVIEHLYNPRSFLCGCFRALKPGGMFILSTPYHGYLKNLLISLRGSWDVHLNPLWDGGHIKLWSWFTIRRALREAGFCDFKFRGAGRLPFLWMTMVVGCRKP